MNGKIFSISDGLAYKRKFLSVVGDTEQMKQVTPFLTKAAAQEIHDDDGVESEAGHDFFPPFHPACRCKAITVTSDELSSAREMVAEDAQELRAMRPEPDDPWANREHIDDDDYDELAKEYQKYHKQIERTKGASRTFDLPEELLARLQEKYGSLQHPLLLQDIAQLNEGYGLTANWMAKAPVQPVTAAVSILPKTVPAVFPEKFKTLREAKAYYAKNYKTFNLIEIAGMEPGMQLAVLNQLEYMRGAYPEVVNSVKGIVWAPAGTKAYSAGSLAATSVKGTNKLYFYESLQEISAAVAQSRVSGHMVDASIGSGVQQTVVHELGHRMHGQLSFKTFQYADSQYTSIVKSLLEDGLDAIYKQTGAEQAWKAFSKTGVLDRKTFISGYGTFFEPLISGLDPKLHKQGAETLAEYFTAKVTKAPLAQASKTYRVVDEFMTYIDNLTKPGTTIGTKAEVNQAISKIFAKYGLVWNP